MGSQPGLAEIPDLTPLERVGPKSYVPYIFPLQLPSDYDLERTVSILKAGHDAARRRIAVLDCEAVPDQDARQAGVLRLQRLTPGNVDDDIVVKDLRAPGAFPMTFAELEAKGFPVSAFDAEAVVRRSVWPSPGERLPVSLAQANFIQGGLVLSWCVFHMIGDGTTFLLWTKIWAEECRRAQGLAITNPLKLDDALIKDRPRSLPCPGEVTNDIQGPT